MACFSVLPAAQTPLLLKITICLNLDPIKKKVYKIKIASSTCDTSEMEIETNYILLQTNITINVSLKVNMVVKILSLRDMFFFKI